MKVRVTTQEVALLLSGCFIRLNSEFVHYHEKHSSRFGTSVGVTRGTKWSVRFILPYVWGVLQQYKLGEFISQ